MKPPHITDHAILRYLERAHGLDVEGVRRYLAGRVSGGARLGAAAVIVDRVKIVMRHHEEGATAVTANKPQWPSREK